MIYKKQRLGDLCNVKIGRTPRRDSPEFWGGSATWVTVRELNGGVVTTSKEQISDLAVREVMPPPIPAGTLLFSFKLSIGKMAVAGVPLYTNEAIAALIITDSSVLDRDYLRFALMASSSEEDANHAVLGKVLNKEKVEGIQIPIPPITEQRRIVDLLSRAEGIVRLRREAEKKAAELIPALFIDIFGDTASNPKGWAVRKVSDFVTRFEGGKNIQAGSENGSDYRILKVSAVTSGTYRESESKPSPDSYTPPPSHIIRAGDMLFSRANTVDLVGATAVVSKTNGKTLLPDKLWRFVWAEPVESAYMHALFQSSSVRQELGKLSSGTSASMRNISQGKLFNLLLPVAPYQLQRDFALKASMIQSIQSQQRDATAKAQVTFNSLLAQIFSQ